MVEDIEMGMEVPMSEETTVKFPGSCKISNRNCGSSVCTSVLGGTVLFLAGFAVCSQSGHIGRRLCFESLECANWKRYGRGHLGGRCGCDKDGCEPEIDPEKSECPKGCFPTIGFFGCQTNFNWVWRDFWNCACCTLNLITLRACERDLEFEETCCGLAPENRKTPWRFCGTTLCATKNGDCCSIFKGVCDECDKQSNTWLLDCAPQCLARLKYCNLIEGSYWFLSARWSPFQCLCDIWQSCKACNNNKEPQGCCLEDKYPVVENKTPPKAKTDPVEANTAPAKESTAPAKENTAPAKLTAAPPKSKKDPAPSKKKEASKEASKR